MTTEMQEFLTRKRDAVVFARAQDQDSHGESMYYVGVIVGLLQAGAITHDEYRQFSLDGVRQHERAAEHVRRESLTESQLIADATR